ncbi:hypothetical protein VTK26DRAFT_8859 [Humicola hyalothermophila]
MALPSEANGSSSYNEGKAAEHRSLLLVSVPRTASNLLVRVLNIRNQPQVVTNSHAGYFFYQPHMIAARELKRPPSQWTNDEKARVREAYQESLNSIEEMRAVARRENKIMFAKEHAFWVADPAAMPGTAGGRGARAPSFFRLRFPDMYGEQQTFSPNNCTLFPDEYLRTWRIAFVIRHPALAWPSMYRAMVKMVDEKLLDEDGVRGASLANMSLAWTRKMFDWALEHDPATVPLVIDAHDVIHNPAAVRRFCELAGLDASKVQFEWDETPVAGWQDQQDLQGAKIMCSTLEASRGLLKDKTPATVDVTTEAEKWKAEFGEEVAALVEKAVWDALPDYEYLKERRVQA